MLLSFLVSFQERSGASKREQSLSARAVPVSSSRYRWVFAINVNGRFGSLYPIMQFATC